MNKQPAWKGILLCLVLLLIIVVGFRLSRPPAPLAADAPAEVFSAERAAAHLPHIASIPNPIGSKANLEVRQYLMDQLRQMGLEPELHLTEYFYAQRAATLGNVLARIAGTGDGRAILFMGHYDTVVSAPGASDNGAAVVTMLEVIRMLQHHPPLENDLIFFFPDGEEYGLLGAQAFMAEHPWVEDVVMVVNLEAMGTTGQSLLFETGADNMEAIRSFARAVPYPAGNSLSVEVYKRMPNATDYDVFKRRGYQGLNFAYIGSSYHYHTAGDNIENTCLRSVQHHGEHTAALAVYLGNATPDFSSAQDAVYFNTIGYGFAWYPYSWAVYTGVLAFLMVLFVLFIGIRRQMIRPLHLAYIILAILIKLLMLYYSFDAMYHILRDSLGPENLRLLQYNQKGLLLAFALLATAISFLWYRLLMRGFKAWELAYFWSTPTILMAWGSTLSLTKVLVGLALWLWLYIVHRRPIQWSSLSSGAISIWALLALGASLFLPGGSYLFTWPLLFSLIPLAYAYFFRLTPAQGWLSPMLFALFAIPLLIWFSQLLYLLSQAMGPSILPMGMIAAGLALSLLTPHIWLATRNKAWITTSAFALAGLLALGVYGIWPDYNEYHRKANHIIHATDGNSKEAFWISLADKSDEWTIQFIGEEPDSIPLSTFYPYAGGSALGLPAPITDIIPPIITSLSDTVMGDERILKLRVQSFSGAGQLFFHFQAGDRPLSIEVGESGRRSLPERGSSGWYWFFYLAPPEEEIQLSLYGEAGQDILLHINEVDYSGIPTGIRDFSPRPPHMMPAGDRSMISHSFSF